jgi:hypothetical protein
MLRFLRLALPSSLLLVVFGASAQEAPAPGSPPSPAQPPNGWVEPAPAAPERLPALVPATPPEASPAPTQPAGAAVLRVSPASRPADADAGGLRKPPAAPSTRVFMGANVGWAGGRFTHPELYGRGFSGLNIGAHAGVALTRSIALGLDFNAYRTSLEYVGDGLYGYKGADNPRFVNGARLAAQCSNCGEMPGGGYEQSGPLNVLTLGPRLQFALDPARGPFAALTGGVTFLEGVIDNRTGAALGARGGYRLAVSEQVGVALEVGGTAHRFSGATSAFGFGGLQLQMRL